MQHAASAVPAWVGILLVTASLGLGGCQTTRGPLWETELAGDTLPAGAEASAHELYARRFAGVRLFQHPDGISVIIRGGVTSFRAGSAPLYIVDGFAMTPNERGRLMINPHDIERIQVLKNIDETAFYGSRGANGVVVITTRRGR